MLSEEPFIIKEDSASLSNTPGMGSVSLPSQSSTGSGDFPRPILNTFNQKSTKKIISFQEFIEFNKVKK